MAQGMTVNIQKVATPPAKDPYCKYKCGRRSRTSGRCAVCDSYVKRRAKGHKVYALEVLELKLRVAELEAEIDMLNRDPIWGQR